MFSKNSYAFLASLLFVLGCSKGDIPANQVGLTYGSTKCFKGMGQRFQDFFAGGGSADQVHANWTCMANLLSDFSRINETSQFPKDKLLAFINDHYQLGLTDQVMQSTMKLKQVLAGGDLNVITKDEINIIIHDLDTLDGVTAALAPYASVIFGADNAKVSEAQWNQAYRAFADQLPKLAGLLSVQNQAYAFADLQTFATALANQFQASNNSFIRKLAALIPVMASAKTLLISGSKDQMLSGEWRPLFAEIGALYTTYESMERAMGLHPSDASLALSEPRIETVIQNVVEILSSAVQARANKQIAFSEIQDFLKQLEVAGLLPKALSADQAGQALQFLILKIFPAPSAASNALDAIHVAEMKKFVTRLQMVTKAYVSGQAEAIPDFAAAIQSGNWKLNLDSNGRLVIPPGVANIRQEFPAIFTVLEWLGEKWGTWPLSAAAFHSAVTDLLAFIHSFNYLQSTDDTIYTRLLREANLFMPSSNGNMLLEIPEAFQYALFALSSYRSSHALGLAANNGCADADFACYQKILLANRIMLLSNLPHLNQWLGSDRARFNGFTQEVSVIVGTSELMEFMVLNYIETFMQRFDANHDGLITLTEAQEAFKIYGPVLGDMLESHGIAADDVGPLYTFLFAYGRTPGSENFDSERWLWWKISSNEWFFSADRKTLASILAELAKL
jgi:hypothetical protein